jgi:hypothetical protein
MARSMLTHAIVPAGASTDAAAAPRMSNLRTYLAGTGATGALMAGALLVFLSIAAFVSFNGFPLGSTGSSLDSLYLGRPAAPGAPEAAAVALGAAGRGAVAATPAGVGITAGAASATGPGGTTPGTDGTTPGGPQLPPPDQPGGGNDGPVTNVVHTVNNTVGGITGGDVPLSGVTDPVTSSLDRTLDNVLNPVGGLLGHPKLGTGVTGAVNTLTGGALGLTH